MCQACETGPGLEQILLRPPPPEHRRGAEIWLRDDKSEQALAQTPGPLSKIPGPLSKIRGHLFRRHFCQHLRGGHRFSGFSWKTEAGGRSFGDFFFKGLAVPLPSTYSFKSYRLAALSVSAPGVGRGAVYRSGVITPAPPARQLKVPL